MKLRLQAERLAEKILAHDYGEDFCAAVDAGADLIEEALAQREQWMPIETAPDKGEFDAWTASGGRHTNCYKYRGAIAKNYGYPAQTVILQDVTHWMPLPTAPNTTPNPTAYERGKLDGLKRAAEICDGARTQFQKGIGDCAGNKVAVSGMLMAANAFDGVIKAITAEEGGA